MDGYKEFKGKTLDSAIEEACSYFNSPREKLEIDLINDAKTGIFGLVGAKKARIRARRMQVQFGSQALSAPSETSRRSKKSTASVMAEPETERKAEKPKQRQERPHKRSERPQPVKQQKPKEKTEAFSEEAQTAKPKQERGRPQRSKPEGNRGQKPTQKPFEKPQGVKPARKKQEASEENREGQQRGRNDQRRPQKAHSPRQDNASAPRQQRPVRPAPVIEPVKADPIPEANLDELDQTELLKVVTEVVNRLITPVIGETPVEARIEDGRVKASISSGDNSGLLIGREGQTLASFQYLANRIVAKMFGVAVRVQLDTGDYRERQDEKLRDIALHLAEKAKTMGKPQSTRPLSSYHRRVVHLVLQEDDEIQTRSKGDGPLKRVIIGRKRK
jgi:spoIIIJ-associated protein